MALSLSFALCNFFLVLPVISAYSTSDSINTFSNKDKAKFLLPNEKHVANESSAETIGIYCSESVNKSLLYMWRSVHLELEHAPITYEIYTGENATEVYTKYTQHSYWAPVLWITKDDTIIEFPAFSQYCVGIVTKEKYVLYLRVRITNYWKVLQTIIGILLYLSAPTLSRNSFFHYTSGVSLGVLASLLVLIYILSRFLPRKTSSYIFLGLSYSVCLYALQRFAQEFTSLVANYTDIALAYCFVAAAISFIVCYRLGPVTNVRTFHLIQWAMQGIGLLLIFFSSEYRALSAALIIILLLASVFPTSWITKGKYVWYHFFPPKIKLITDAEYTEIGIVETKKGLDNLRNYCHSPDCHVWKIVSKLKDPVRFASFVENGVQFTNDELLNYASDDIQYDSDSNITDDDNEEAVLSNSANVSANGRYHML